MGNSAKAKKAEGRLKTRDLQEALRALKGEDGEGDVVELNMGFANIGDEGAKAIGEALKSNGTLSSLNLGYNRIGVEGVKAVGEALKVNGTLISLDLAVNKVGDKGAKAIAEALKSNGTLTRLDLRMNPIGNEGTIALFCSLEHRGSNSSDDGNELKWYLDNEVPSTSTSLQKPTPALEMIKRLIENGKGNFAVNISKKLGTDELKAFAKGWHQLKQNGISDLAMPPQPVIHQGSKNIESFFNELSSGDKSQTTTRTKAESQSKSQSTANPPPTDRESRQAASKQQSEKEESSSSFRENHE